MVSKIKDVAKRWIGLPGAEGYVRQIVARGECLRALDIGCGATSILSQFRPRVHTVGLDGFEPSIAAARARGLHDEYVLGDILKLSTEELLHRCGGQPFDLVTLLDVIEHLPKRQGFELLEKCEQLSRKYVVVETPNGFVEQGPEFGNEFQRHLSGWFAHDFEGLGYKVYGSKGTRFLLGYAGCPRYPIPETYSLDAALAWLLRVEKRHRWAFGLVAIKDVRGVPARLPARPAEPR